MKAKNEGHALTSAGEDYLEAIYCVMLEHPGEDSVRSVDVSERLNVTKASVNKALSALKDGGFVDQTRYGRVELTEEGKTYAAEVWGRHRMLRSFLTVELGVDEEVADEDGFGLGFERLVLFVTGMANIRDVIAFPRYPGNANF